ncbi:MAG: hypothetical protein M3341_08725 [Actinomycetota bacterium]|nr:hypothetical protein [Actinomycetota bacterium]
MSRYRLGPPRIGFFYGAIAVVVALAADLRFLFVDPQGIPDWILTAIEEFRTQLALTVTLFLGILAAIRTRPTRVDPGVPYRSLLLRDCVLAATVVAAMVGFALFVATALNATLFADEIRAYASEAAPSIVAYNEKVAGRLDDPPPLPSVAEIEEDLQPPGLRDLGRSMANFVLRALVVGTAGALVALIRGRAGPSDGPKPRAG